MKGPFVYRLTVSHALVADEVLDQLDLVVLPLANEALERLADRDVLAHEPLVGLDVLAHLRLDRLEVVLRERHALRELEVVVEAVLDRRGRSRLRARIQLEHRLGEHVRGVVADQPQRLVAAPVGDDLELLGPSVRSGQRPVEVAELAVDLDRERRPSQPGPIAAAASAPVAPSGRSRMLPSGSSSCIAAGLYG